MSKSIKLKNDVYLDLESIANECVTYTISGRSDLSTGKIPFNTIYSKTNKNNSFKLDGNDILFLKDCKVLISMTIAMYLENASIWIGINLNDKRIGTIIEIPEISGYRTFSISPKLIDVKKGDKLSANIVNNSNIIIGAFLDNIDAVYLTVQRIN